MWFLIFVFHRTHFVCCAFVANIHRQYAEDAASTLPASIQKLQVSSAAHQKQQELLKQVAEQQFIPKEPPPETEFIADPPSISALDLYVFSSIYGRIASIF